MTIQQDLPAGSSKSSRSAAAVIDPQLGEAAALAASGMGEAVMKDGERAVKEVEAGAAQWKSWAHGAYQANAKAWRALMACRSAKAVAVVHARLMQDHVDLMMGSSRRMTAAMVKSSGARHVK